MIDRVAVESFCLGPGGTMVCAVALAADCAPEAVDPGRTLPTSKIGRIFLIAYPESSD